MTTPQAGAGRPVERIVIAPGVVGDLAVPATTPAPAVIVVHEWYGLTDDIRDLARRFAEDGFVALAPDLFAGEVATDAARGRQLADGLDTRGAMRDLGDAVRWLGDDERAGAIGITGFCLGGAMALAAAGHVDGLAAAAPFYGIPRADWLDPVRVRVPVQGHFGARDAAIPVERPRQVFQSLASAGVDVELHIYDAGHAFMRRGGPGFDEVAATAAWSRVVAFFRRHLA
jgi:carboxymethylenebutenolidase